MATIQFKILPPARDPASWADLLDFLRVGISARKQSSVQRLAAARWSARMQDRLRIIRAKNEQSR